MRYLFCDESGTAGDQYILVIGLLQTPAPDELRVMVEDARTTHRLTDELHFWKHSRRKLAFARKHLTRIQREESKGHAKIWRWRPSEAESMPPPH